MKIKTITHSRTGYKEHFIHVCKKVNDDPESMFKKSSLVVRDLGCLIVSQEIFGVSNRKGRGFEALQQAFGEIRWPVTWIEEGAEDDAPLFGMHIWAVSGIPVEPLELDGSVVGTFFEDTHARICRLGGLLPPAGEPVQDRQARQVLDEMNAVLETVGMDFSRVVRTWFFNRDILAWYETFNKTRDAFFHEHGVYDGLVPASTGVGARNGTGAWLVGGLLAIDPRNERIKIKPVPSVMQCPALDYGSSFSRAVEITFPEYRRLFVSGTASIALEGHTMHVDDPDGQVNLTMEVVHAILESRAMDWKDITRATVYFKETGHAEAYDRWCDRHPDVSLPAVVVKSTICREDLLYEIEVDASVRS